MYDVAIIGGGVSGLACAHQLGQAGYRVALFERGKLGEGTSANSLRIIHGGFRYLKDFDFLRTQESSKSLKETKRQFSEAVEYLPCLMPLSRFGLQSRLPVTAACWIYNLFFGSGIKHAKVVNQKSVAEVAPFIEKRCRYGALQWFDGLLKDPSNIITSIAYSCLNVKTELFEDSPINEIERSDTEWRISISGSLRDVRSRLIVNAAGPWISSIKGLPQNDFQWCIGYNIVLKKAFPSTHAVGVPSLANRLFFFVPRSHNVCAIGTGYFSVQKVEEKPHVPQDKIEEFIKEASEALPEFSFSMNDIEKIEAGYLPQEGIKNGDPKLIGAARISAQNGYIEVLSTKYTTFLSQARKVTALVRSLS